jgi:gas vesicle protein
MREKLRECQEENQRNREALKNMIKNNSRE